MNPHNDAPPPERSRREPSRRSLLLGGAAVGIGVVATASAARTGVLPAPSQPDRGGLNGDRVVPFYGAHQAGVTSTPGAFVTYVSLALLPSTTREDVRSLMRLLTDDASRLTQGIGPLADIEPELVANPAGLTVTFGFGEGFVARAGATAPRWLAPLPTFSIDRLEERYSGADLLLILHGDDKVVISHAVRLLLRDSRRFASHLWTQSGFRQSYGTAPHGTTMRNLFGQLDGTANFAPGSKDFDAAVSARADAPGWLQGGGTSFVLRRIAMDLEGWDEVGREGRGEVVGRHIDTGAPLTGKHEHDAPDFEAKGPLGFTVINPASHIARAHAAEPEQSIVRMAHNYDDPPEGEATSNVGLLFGSWQADVAAQFVPMQERLAQGDLLNQWTTPIGSTVVAIPPGCEPGGFIGEGLLS